jgi:hypothetical protein
MNAFAARKIRGNIETPVAIERTGRIGSKP